MFAADITHTIDIDGTSVTIKKLSWRSLRNARERKVDEYAVAAQKYKAVHGESEKEDPEAIKKARADVEADPALKRAVTYESYERTAVLQAGIKSWDSDRAISVESIEELTEDAADRLFKAIIDLSIPDESPKA